MRLLLHALSAPMGPPTLRTMVIWLLAPALLVGVVGVHSYLVAAKNQTPWEGGGFGMFSTVDKRQARFVRCTLLTPRGEARVQLPEHLTTYVERLRARPTQTRVESLARYLAGATWIETASDSTSDAGPPRYLPSHETSDRPPVPVEAVRVEVWRYRFVSRPYGLEADTLLSARRRVTDTPPID